MELHLIALVLGSKRWLLLTVSNTISFVHPSSSTPSMHPTIFCLTFTLLRLSAPRNPWPYLQPKRNLSYPSSPDYLLHVAPATPFAHSFSPQSNYDFHRRGGVFLQRKLARLIVRGFWTTNRHEWAYQYWWMDQGLTLVTGRGREDRTWGFSINLPRLGSYASVESGDSLFVGAFVGAMRGVREHGIGAKLWKRRYGAILGGEESISIADWVVFDILRYVESHRIDIFM
jgi:hypothetical protein